MSLLIYLRQGAGTPNNIILRDPTQPDSGGTAYSLTAQYGAFAITAETSTLVVARLVTAAQASFTLTSKTAGLTVARMVTASYGAFSLTGETAGLTVARKITASYGAFAITSQTSSLKVARIVTASYGAFSITGETAGLAVARLLTASPASYTLTPQTAGLLYTQAGGQSYTLTAQFGAFALSGQTATLTYTPAPQIIRPKQYVSAGTGGIWYSYYDLFKKGKKKLREAQDRIPEAPKERPMSPAMVAAIQRMATKPRRTLRVEPMDLAPVKEAVTRQISHSKRLARERRDREAIEV